MAKNNEEKQCFLNLIELEYKIHKCFNKNHFLNPYSPEKS